MIDLFYRGGPLFMTLLTAIALLSIAAMIGHQTRSWSLRYVKETGYLGLTLGIFGQLIGLYEAFQAVEAMGEVSPAMMMGGLKVSMITTLYGFSILILTQVYALLTKSK